MTDLLTDELILKEINQLISHIIPSDRINSNVVYISNDVQVQEYIKSTCNVLIYTLSLVVRYSSPEGFSCD